MSLRIRCHPHYQPRETLWASGGPKPRLWKSGETEDGRGLIAGTFRFVDEKGIPLDLLVSSIDDSGGVVDWLDFYASAMKQGWKPRRTFIKLQAVVGDVYGPEFRKGWEERMLAHHPECAE